MTKNFTLGLILVLAAAAQVSAQERPDAPAVTISVSAKGVRVAALGAVKQIRLEVFAEGGDTLYSSGFQSGNVRDWNLEDRQGQRLPDGRYLCITTFRGLSGKLGMKQGALVLQGGRASLEMAEVGQAGAGESEKTPSAAEGGDGSSEAMTLTAHDGREGQVVTTRGALSFRTGDFFTAKDRELMRLTPEGDLGVGVAAPKAKLDVAGTIRARGIQFDDGTVLTSARRASLVSPPASSTSADDPPAAAVAGTGTPNKLTKWTDGTGTLSDSVLYEAGGKLGIGTATPAASLDSVYNNNSFGFGFNIKNTSAGDKAIAGYGIDNAAGARVGQFAYFSSNYVVAGLRNSVLFSSAGPTAALGFVSSADGSGKPDLFFRAGTGADIMRMIGSTGFVGIGTSNPRSRLEVAGDIKVSGSAVVDGNIAAKYQDVAEWVRAREPLAAGTVVILDRRHTNTIGASTRPYDTHVAGVVSAQPGVILGEAGEGKVMVATTGRVKVRVDATRRPIRIGDLLVTSARLGLAMRSVPVRVGYMRMHRPGTIIGKALEPLADGEGEILVLLSLQ
jgi:hypothetical protein